MSKWSFLLLMGLSLFWLGGNIVATTDRSAPDWDGFSMTVSWTLNLALIALSVRDFVRHRAQP